MLNRIVVSWLMVCAVWLAASAELPEVKGVDAQPLSAQARRG